MLKEKNIKTVALSSYIIYCLSLNHWNDSLKIALNDLQLLFKDLEVLQNEFEIDLLRLHSQGREQKKKIEYFEDDLVDQRVRIASNRQEISNLDSLNEDLKKIRKKLSTTADQTYLLSGNLSTIKNSLNERKRLTSEINNLQNELNLLDNKVNELSNDLRTNEEKIRLSDEEISSIKDSIKSISTSIKKINSKIEKLKTQVESIPIPEK